MRSVPLTERHDMEQKWHAYSALPDEKKEALKAAPKAVAPALSSAPIARPPKAVSIVPKRPPNPLIPPSAQGRRVQSAPVAK